MEIWKTLRVSHISPPTTNTDKGQKRRYTNIPLGTKVRSGQTASTVCPQPISGWTNVCNPVTNYGFATTTGATVFSFPVPTAAYPMLQAQDGTFYGYDDQGNMIRMTGSGQTLWKVPGDYPVIATADGGVIGHSGITYDNQGRATGQVANATATQSWTGHIYTDGDVRQIASPATAMASTFAFWPWGGNNTATLQQDFPPLESCTIPRCVVGPRDALYGALFDLIKRLESPAIVAYDSNHNPLTLGAVAQSKIFNLLGNEWTTGGFIKYLTNQTPLFYNGLTSSYCQRSLFPNAAACWAQVGVGFSLYQTVGDFFNSSAGAATDAETDTPHNPLRIFFRPSSILYADAGVNLGNEGTIFHEALHGWTGQQDDTILGEFSKSRPSCNIDVYIQDNVLLLALGLDLTHSSCP